MTQAQWLAQARQRLEASGCPDPEIDAEWLLEHVLGIADRRVLRAQRAAALAPEAQARLEALLIRREAGEPVQYITGVAWFYGEAFSVDPRVLIPRADTENLVEAAARFLNDRARRTAASLDVLDLCTGSGAIGLMLARLCPAVRATLSDLSADALAVARRNGADLGVDAELLQGDLFAPLSGRRFDLIACNPPYIPRGDLDGLQREVRHEPTLALDGGADGLDFYRRLAAEAGEHLVPGGRIYLEVGAGQARDVQALLRASLRPADGGIIDDLNGIARVVWCETAAH